MRSSGPLPRRSPAIFPDAEIRLLGTGHFALETNGQEITDLMRDFLHRIR
jgi:hypothetical protein